MKTSKKGIKLIKDFEGFKSTPYLCSAKKPTIGYGSTYYLDGRAVTMKDKAISEIEAHELFINVLAKIENDVNKKITVILNQNQFDALISHTYNTGGSANLFRLINQSDFKEAEDWIRTRYITAAGKKVEGLIKRRRIEADLFIS